MFSTQNTKHKIIKKLNPQLASYSVEAMAIVIASKKERLLAKNKDLICFDFNDASELKPFLNRIQQQKQFIPANTRFQFVYLYGGHWMSADVRVNDNKVEFIIIDPLNSPVFTLNIIQAIKQVLPEAKITYASGEITRLQHDEINCGTFAVDLAFCMANLPDLHDIFDKIAVTPSDVMKLFLAKYIHEGSIKTIDVGNFPLEFGQLIRNMQSISTLRDTFYHKGYRANNKKSLEDYVAENTGEVIREGEKKDENIAISKKREKLKQKALTFFNALDQDGCTNIMNNRTGKNCQFFKPSMQDVDYDIEDPKEDDVSEQVSIMYL